MCLGKPTGAAMPLMWAHAEYIKLLRSTRDGKVFDLIPEVAQHFRVGRRRLRDWRSGNSTARSGRSPPGVTLRILADRPFALHWCLDDWNNHTDTDSTSTLIGLHYVDIAVPKGQTAPLKFTFRWLDKNQWEGKDFEVAIKRD